MGLLLCNSPSKIHFLYVNEVFLALSSEFWEDKAGQDISLSVHVAECGRDEHSSLPPAKDIKGLRTVPSYVKMFAKYESFAYVMVTEILQNNTTQFHKEVP